MAKKPQRKKSSTPENPTQRTCGTMPVHERLLRTVPEYITARSLSENHARSFAARRGMMGRSGVTVIPVVVHVVHDPADAAQNISDAQIQSQIDILNQDFRAQNADFSQIPAAFSSLGADARIEFELATTDPSGNPTSGITRTPSTSGPFSDDDSVKSASTGGVDAWPRDDYLNIWVCQLAGGLLGYAQFPGGPAATDGVVIRRSAFGNTGTAAAPFDLGRTTTHEIGHWLNLRHIWGDDGTGCSGSDYVADTPNQGGANYGTPTFPSVTCSNGPNGDLFMDYMDYVDDSAMFMFTAGQVTRMHACLDSDRSSIGHTKPEPTMPQSDIGTLKFQEEPPITIAQLDVATISFIDNPIHTLAQFDLATLWIFDHGGTNPHIDPVKHPAYDKHPDSDWGKPPAMDGPHIPGGTFPPGGPPGGPMGTPFVLATPHHSMAWARSFPGIAQSTVASYESQLQQYERVLAQYAQADRTGSLTPDQQQQAAALYQQYQLLLQEYQQFIEAEESE